METIIMVISIISLIIFLAASAFTIYKVIK